MPNKPRLLFFEDDYETLRHLREYLEVDLGWQVEVTAEASILERLARETFDLILIDIMVRPESLDAEGHGVQNVHFDEVSWLRTGLAFLEHLRSGDFVVTPGQGTPPDVPVIVLSAVAHYSVENELPPSSATIDYVEKPFRVSDLVARIERLMQE
jgi:CheY-like chemotaxis protein